MKFALIFQNDTAAFLPELFLAISLLVVLIHGGCLKYLAQTSSTLGKVKESCIKELQIKLVGCVLSFLSTKMTPTL